MNLPQHIYKLIIFSFLFCFYQASFANSLNASRVTQELVNPPYLPEHSQVALGPPKIVQIDMIIQEKDNEADSYEDLSTYQKKNQGLMNIDFDNQLSLQFQLFYYYH